MCKKLFGILALFSFLPYFSVCQINFGKMVGIIFYPDKQIVSPENLS